MVVRVVLLMVGAGVVGADVVGAGVVGANVGARVLHSMDMVYAPLSVL